MKNNLPDPKNNTLWKYASLGTQFLFGIGIFLYAGIKVDHWLSLQTPVASWLFPLIFITAIIIKIIIETNKKI